MELYRDKGFVPEARAKDLASRLTLREKVGQLNQRLYGFSCYERRGGDYTLTKGFYEEIERWSGLGFLYGLFRADPWSKRDFATGIPPTDARLVYNKVQKAVINSSRFGIPALMTTEAPHGHQALGSLLLPVPLAMGATFNPALVRESFEASAVEMKRMGVHLALISVLDVLRDPRWGRSEECFGEDPFLGASMAFSAVEGVRDGGLEAAAKHFAAQGETTGGVNASPARIGPRELREIHLPLAEFAVKAGAAGIMAAYNEIDGTPCHANPALLQGILRKELGFAGIVMADGLAVDNLTNLTGSPAASGALALQSGVDVGLWDEAFAHLEEAVDAGLIAESIIDRAVHRVLALKFKMGLFENPFLEEPGESGCSMPVHTKAPAASEPNASLAVARESIVLLENRGILPLALASGTKIAVIGPCGDDLYAQLGDYSPPQAPGTGTTLFQGLAGRLVPDGCSVSYYPGCGILRADEEAAKKAVKAASESDIVVLALGGSSSRFSGRAEFLGNGAVAGNGLQADCGEGLDVASIELPECQRAVAEAVFTCGKPLVLVVNAGRPYALGALAGKADAVVYSFYPGPHGGQALAELLAGNIAPSGRLPASLPRSTGHLPCCYNRSSGYRAVYADGADPAQYTFGYGLGYTHFAYSEIACLWRDGTAVIQLRARNEGKWPGWCVPMAFVKRHFAGHVPRAKELAGFTKQYLEPGGTQQVEIPLGKAAFDAQVVLLEEGGSLICTLNLPPAGET